MNDLKLERLNRVFKYNEKRVLLDWLERFGSRFQTGLIITDPASGDDSIVFVNNAFTKITGYSFEDVNGKNLRIMHGEDTDQDILRSIDKRLHKGKHVIAEILNYKKDGTPFWNELVIQPLVDNEGKILYIASFILDVTERKKGESLLRLQEKILTGINEGEELDVLLQKICNVVESFFPTGSVCSILFKEKNEGWYIGAADSVPEELLREMLSHASLKTNEQPDELWIEENIQEAFDWKIHIDNYNSHGFTSNWSIPAKDRDGILNGIFTIFMKKTGAPTETQVQFIKKLTPLIQMTRTYYEQRTEYRKLAYTDPETGLPNRHAFLNKLRENMKDNGKHFVGVVEPGEYSKIVDLYGRGAADELFVQLAKRVEKVGKGKPNFVGRFSSDSLILTNQFVGGDGDHYVISLNEIASEPFIVAGNEMFITLKVGISLSTNDFQDVDEMIRRADIAMSDSKKKSGNSMSFYRNLQSVETDKEITIFNELSRALSMNELDVHLQPKVNLIDGEIIGFEALARWFSPVLGQVPPSLFIPAAENIGKIIDLEIGILSKVMEWQHKRLKAGKKLYQVAVNISVDHFFHPLFTQQLTNLARVYQIPPECIRLELTESIGLVDFVRAKQIFEKLISFGFEISIDDFGVGFSSLSYLPQLLVSELKIDRSFIKALDEPETRAVVLTIIQLANNLKLTTVAEGIEEERHIEILRSLGCKVGQGFYYYKPMPLYEVDALLDRK